MKKIVILISLVMVVLLGYSQRTVTGPRQSGNRTVPSATVRTPSVSKPQTPSVTMVQPTTTQVQRQTYRQPNTTPSRPQATPNYTVRPGTTQTIVQRRSPMPESYKIPQKPSNTGVTQSSDKRGYVHGPRPETHATPRPQPHGPSYGNAHPVPHGYHPRPPMHHPIHHRPIPMHHCIYDHWRFSGMLWHNYWYHMHTYSYLPHSVVIVNFNRMGYPNKLIDYVVTDSLIFSLYVDNLSGKRYFAITDDNDNTLARVEVARRYEKIMVDQYGVWLLPRNGNNPMYFMFIDGELYIYDCD